MGVESFIKDAEAIFLPYSRRTQDALKAVDVRAVAEAAWLLGAEHRLGHAVFIIGNGGSLSNAVHIASDLARAGVHRVYDPLSLAYLTAVANDENYTNIFLRYLQARAAPGDALIALSVSKLSPNVVAACHYWQSRGDVIGLWGQREPKGADQYADISIYVEDPDPKIVETVHLAIGQAWASMALLPQ